MLRGLLNRFSGAQPDHAAPLPARPAGHVIWCHAPLGLSRNATLGLRDILLALNAQTDMPVQFLLTGDAPPLAKTGILHSAPPDAASLPAFLAHWSPSAVLWLGPGDSALAQACADQGHAPVLLTLTTAGPLHPAAFQKAITGPLCPDPPILPCNEAEAEDLSGLLRGRPVWLAVLPPPSELPALIAAHRAAAQVSHRLLLLLVLPSDTAADAASDLTAAGWQIKQRESGQDPDDGCEIYIIEGSEELGLWYRLSPVTYLGGSLTTGCGNDPLAAAAMGSALICGPQGGLFDRTMSALDLAGALLRLAGPADLNAAVLRLLAPDQTAQLANAGWLEATKGAPLQNATLDLLRPICQSPVS